MDSDDLPTSKSPFKNIASNVSLPALLLIVVFLGGCTTGWTQAFFFIGIGVFLYKKPPKLITYREIDYCIIGLAGIVLFQFLPISNLFSPSWRTLSKDLELATSISISPQPRISFEALCIFLGATGGFYILCNYKADSPKLRLWGLSIITLVLSIGAIIGNLQNLKYPLAEASQVFTYFPNRNQTSTCLALGTITSFCLMVLSIKKSQKLESILTLCITSVSFFALVVMTSRAGVVLFLSGICIWQYLKQKTIPKRILFQYLIPAIVIFASIVILTASENNLNRFFNIFTSTFGESSAFRPRIYKDTLGLIADQPLQGIGLGNFQYIIPQYREASLHYSNTIHPENDWLWAWAELGTIGFLIIAFGVFRLIKNIFTKDTSDPYKLIAQTCFIVFLLNTFIDVPAHRIGTVLFAAAFISIFIEDNSKTIIPSKVFKTTGLLLTVIGSAWLSTYAWDLPFYSKKIIERTKDTSVKAYEHQNFDASMNALHTGSTWTPLDPWWYFIKAQNELVLKQNTERARLNFKRSDLLSPNEAQFSLLEGWLWIPYSYQSAFSAWQRALSKKNVDPESSWIFILNKSLNKPGIEPYLSKLSKTDNNFRIFYLKKINPYFFTEEILKEIKYSELLEHIPESIRLEFLIKWANTPEAKECLSYLKKNPNVLTYNWIPEAIAQGSSGNYKEASYILSQNLDKPTIDLQKSIFKTTEELLREFELTNNLQTGIYLLKSKISEGDIEKAHYLINKIRRIKHHPKYIDLLEGELYFQKEEYEKSWIAFKKYLDQNLITYIEASS